MCGMLVSHLKKNIFFLFMSGKKGTSRRYIEITNKYQLQIYLFNSFPIVGTLLMVVK